jgi:multiple sugar transport system ATP-binding protein
LAEIELDRVSKDFPGCVAVDDVSLRIEDGEFLVLVGPSGCGKSTLLRMIAGLEEVTDGRILIGSRDVTDLAPRARDVAMVFQSYALYPHMTVRQNLGYGLKVRKSSKADIARRVTDVARMLRLEELLDRRPAALSGGQRQRVAMGRAVVREPKAFLMDEPLSNLDAKLRVSMRAELASLHARLGATTVYVTHDQVEAMTLGQRVAVMRDGRIQQVDTPQALYRLPQNLFVAAFIGSPAMNLVEARLDDGRVEFGGRRFPLTGDRRPSRTSGQVILGVRPESFQDAAFADASLPQLDVEVTVVEELGSDTHVLFSVDAPRVDTEEVRQSREGEDVGVLLAGDRAVFTARVDPRTAARAGRPLRLSLDPAGFHFFDPSTGLADLEEPAVPPRTASFDAASRPGPSLASRADEPPFGLETAAR